MIGQIRILCGKCHACGCDECFADDKCRNCQASITHRYREKHIGHAWVRDLSFVNDGSLSVVKSVDTEPSSDINDHDKSLEEVKETYSMKDPVPGVDPTEPTIYQRIRAYMPKMFGINRDKAGELCSQTGKYILYGSAITVGAIAFLARPVITLAFGAGLKLFGDALQKDSEIKMAVAEVESTQEI